MSETRVTCIRLGVEISQFDDAGKITARGPRTIDLIEAEIPEEIMEFVKRRLNGELR
jgi:hypothetical protein